MVECVTILHTTVKSPMLNTLKKFYIYKETLHSTQLNNKNTITPNAIFDAVLHNNSDSTLHIQAKPSSIHQSSTERAHNN
jgi:hypothetical protein